MKGAVLEDMHSLAKLKGGKCLSKQYINSKIPLQWQCIKGHIWKATTNNVKRGTWCPYCANTVKSTIEQMKKLAQNKFDILNRGPSEPSLFFEITVLFQYVLVGILASPTTVNVPKPNGLNKATGIP